MRAGWTIPATCSGFRPRCWPLRAASRECRHESDRRAGKKRISIRTHREGVPPAFCTAGKPGCREQILEYARVPPGDFWPSCQQVGTLPNAFAAQQLHDLRLDDREGRSMNRLDHLLAYRSASLSLSPPVADSYRKIQPRAGQAGFRGRGRRRYAKPRSLLARQGRPIL